MSILAEYAGGSADVLGNHIIHIRDNPFSGCQNGVGVQVGRALEGQSGSARVIGNVIEDHQKNGTTVSNKGSTAEIAYDRIIGAGPTSLIAQNGIQVSSGATAKIRHNFVSGNNYTVANTVSTGVLLFQSGVVTVDHNTVNANDVGIYDFAAASGTASTNNFARASEFYLTHDCHDGSTGNTWTDNEAQTSSPRELCGEDEDADHDDGDHGWDRNYNLNAEYDAPAEMDFTATYSTVDIDGLLQLLPQLQVSGGGHATSPSN